MTKQLVRWISIMILIALLARCGDKNQVSSNGLITDVYIQAYTNHRYDFLFIIDNSPSIVPLINFVKNNLQNFINIINTRKAVDFQMAVATTDYFTEEGRLRQNSVGQKLAKSSDPNPLQIMGTILDKLVGDINAGVSQTAFWERPFDTLRTAMITYSSQFTRSGVDTVAFIMSDENDFSCGPNPRTSPLCSNVAPGTNPIPPGGAITYQRPMDSYFTTVLSQVKKQQQAVLHVVPIVGLNEEDCEIGSVANDTLRLAGLINAAQNGSIKAPGSICEAKIEASFERVANQIANRGVSFKLTKEPKTEIFVVTVNGKVIPQLPDGEWHYEKEINSIVFTGVPPANGATVSISYAKR